MLCEVYLNVCFVLLFWYLLECGKVIYLVDLELVGVLVELWFGDVFLEVF